MHNAHVPEARALPPCVMDVLVECSQQAIVATLDWVPTGDLVPPLTCARLAAEDVFKIFSWREPLETLQSCVQLMLAYLIFYMVFIFTIILFKKLVVGRFRSGTWNIMDVRDKEWTKSVGYVLSVTMFGNDTLSKALTGSQWQVVFYYLSGMRVGRRVFVDRNVVLMGARSASHAPANASACSRIAKQLCPLSCIAQMMTSSSWGTTHAWVPGRTLRPMN